MARNNIYRRVSCRIWADERFRKLSGPKPNAQTLWFHLLFGEQTGIVPGLFRIGEAGFAEQLAWPLQGFRKAFGEIEEQGMVRADWAARLVWVPKAIRYNPPASPNVVRHWGVEWHLLPECQMRTDAQALLEASLEALGKAFRDAFTEVLSGVIAEDIVQSEAVAVTVAVTGSPPKPPAGGPRPSASEKQKQRPRNGGEEAATWTPGVDATRQALDERERVWREDKARTDAASRTWLHERWPDKYPTAEDPKWKQ